VSEKPISITLSIKRCDKLPLEGRIIRPKPYMIVAVCLLLVYGISALAFKVIDSPEWNTIEFEIKLPEKLALLASGLDWSSNSTVYLNIASLVN